MHLFKLSSFILLFFLSNFKALGQYNLDCDTIQSLNLYFNNQVEYITMQGYQNNFYCLSRFQMSPDPTICGHAEFVDLDLGKGDTLNFYIGGKDCYENFNHFQFTHEDTNQVYISFLDKHTFEIEFISDNIDTADGFEIKIFGGNYCEYPAIQTKIQSVFEEPIKNIKVHYANAVNQDSCTTSDFLGGSCYVDYWMNFLWVDPSPVIVAPQSPEDYINGVTTFDVVLIKKHILNIQPLEDHYQLLAADVNNSMTITTADLVELRKLILGKIDRFSNNTSWRFIFNCDAFEEGFFDIQESVMVTGSPPLPYPEFKMIKVGDVNFSAVIDF